MIPVAEAQEIVRAHCRRGSVERVPLARAIGRTLAVDVFSPVDLPPFDNSAMDGFALRCGDGTFRAGDELAVCGEQAAGDGAARSDAEGAWEIMTGASLPAGLDTIVPIEQVDLLECDNQGRPRRIRLKETVVAGAHVRRAGEDVARSALALPAGTRIKAQHVLLLAGLGVAEVPLMQRPRVAVIATGRELVDDPGQPLLPGQIRNSNAPFLSARLHAAGADVVHVETVSDDADQFARALSRAIAAGANTILSTGAVSMGRYDFVPVALRALGAEILFHKVRMRPGKPLLCARLAQGQLYFGLPGNPVSSAVGLRFFVEAALRIALGLAPERAWRLPLQHAVEKRSGFRFHQKARWQLSASGVLGVQLLEGQQSFKTQPLSEADVWAVLAEDAEHLAVGTLVDVYALGHEDSDLLGAAQG